MLAIDSNRKAVDFNPKKYIFLKVSLDLAITYD